MAFPPTNLPATPSSPCHVTPINSCSFDLINTSETLCFATQDRMRGGTAQGNMPSVVAIDERVRYQPAGHPDSNVDGEATTFVLLLFVLSSSFKFIGDDADLCSKEASPAVTTCSVLMHNKRQVLHPNTPDTPTCTDPEPLTSLVAWHTRYPPEIANFVVTLPARGWAADTVRLGRTVGLLLAHQIP